MTSSGTAVVTLPTDTQIVIRREFDAPKHLIYRAYTEPDLIARWWSGERGEVISVGVDLRVGAACRYVMKANEGFEVAFHGEFREIVPNERLVTTEVYEMSFRPRASPISTRRRVMWPRCRAQVRTDLLDRIRRLSSGLPDVLHLPARSVVDLCLRSEGQRHRESTSGGA